MTPTDIAVSRHRNRCTITWSDGAVQELTLADLRRRCPCATCNDARAQRQANPLTVISGPVPSAQLDAVEAVGGYAVRFCWADGHRSGIYSFEFLRELGGLQSA
jgi:DUF971 family protein